MEKEKEPKKRLSVLEIYYARGWLLNKASKWTADDRLKVGKCIACDFYKAGFIPVTAIDYGKERVDCSIKPEPDSVLAAQDRYYKAVEAIPEDFRQIVRDVCCYNEYIKASGNNKMQKSNDRYRKIFDLCRGLDYLVWHYLRGKK